MNSARFNIPVEHVLAVPSPVPPERQHGIAWFARCLRHGLPVEEPFAAGLNEVVCEIVDAAQRSAREGRAVSLR